MVSTAPPTSQRNISQKQGTLQKVIVSEEGQKSPLLKPAPPRELLAHFLTMKVKEGLNKPAAEKIDELIPQVKQILEPSIGTLLKLLGYSQDYKENFAHKIATLITSLAKQVPAAMMNQVIPDEAINKIVLNGIQRRRIVTRRPLKKETSKTAEIKKDEVLQEGQPYCAIVKKFAVKIAKDIAKNYVNSLVHSLFEKVMNKPIETALTLALKTLPIADEVKLLVVEAGKYIAVNYAKNFISYQLKRTLSEEEWKESIKKLDRLSLLEN